MNDLINQIDQMLIKAGLQTYSDLFAKKDCDLINERFGLLVVIGKAQAKANKHYLKCVCDCGNTKDVRRENLLSGSTVSCGYGCTKVSRMRHVTHGKSRDPRYRANYLTWVGMMKRCRSEKATGYKHYGGRGISVCEQWLGPKGFETFLADMGIRPEGKTLDRIDVNGNYEPSNCRWATHKEQSANKRK